MDYFGVYVLIIGRFSHETTGTVPLTVFLVSVNTYTPSGASRAALTPVARTLSMEADWISVATVPMLTMFTWAGEGTGASNISSICQVYLFIPFTYYILRYFYILYNIHVIYVATSQHAMALHNFQFFSNMFCRNQQESYRNDFDPTHKCTVRHW